LTALANLLALREERPFSSLDLQEIQSDDLAIGETQFVVVIFFDPSEY
jgi:hypothetical protein